MSSFSDKVKQVLAAHQSGETGDDPPKGKPKVKGKDVPLTSLLGTLSKVFPATPLQAMPAMGAVVRQRLRDNVNPTGYGSPVSRLVDAVVLNKKDDSRAAAEAGVAGKEEQQYQATRQSYWNKYLGYPYDQKEIAPSAYRPTKAKDPRATYYASASTEAELPSHLGELLLKATDLPTEKSRTHIFKSKEDIKAALQRSRYADDDNPKSYNAGDHLGTMGMDVGEDDNGYYLSYYDSWDVNPFKGANANRSLPGLNGVEDLSMGIGKPFEIYGRVYYDKKTGQRISPPNPKAQSK